LHVRRRPPQAARAAGVTAHGTRIAGVGIIPFAQELSMRVNQLMTSSPRACRPDDHLDAAARIMWDADCGAVPVIDTEQRVVGIVTDRDACMAAYTQGRPLASIPVSDAMATQLFTCHENDDIAEAERLMREAQVRRLPVVDEQGRLVGLLSLNDLAREASHNGKSRGAPEPEDLAATLAAICTPRDLPAPARG
jgi:CBS domain-containing protein